MADRDAIAFPRERRQFGFRAPGKISSFATLMGARSKRRRSRGARLLSSLVLAPVLACSAGAPLNGGTAVAPQATRAPDPVERTGTSTRPGSVERPAPRPAGVIDTLAAKVSPEATPEQAPQARFRHPVVPREKTRGLVLLYHDFSDVASEYSTPPSQLARHVEWLVDNVDIVSLAELLAFLEGELELPARVAVITIDDGLETTYTRAFPIMKRREARFSIGLPTALLERWHEERAVSWEQLREMIDSGLCEIASHGDSHKDLTRIRDDLLDRELLRSRSIIEERLGIEPQAFIYPYGNHDPFVQRRTRAAGYRLAFGVSSGGSRLVRAHTARWAIPRQVVEGSMSPGRLALYFGTPAPAQPRRTD